MQSLDNAMTMTWKRGGIKLDNKGMDKVPAFVPVGQEVMERYAEKVGGIPQNAITEITMNMATTAHVLGGCPMSDTPQHGVVSPNFQVHNYPNMYILDGSIIPCNLGVNPSLTITALSEYAMAQIPHKEGTKRTPIGFSHIEQMPKK
jgi:cholesterol oxidase